MIAYSIIENDIETAEPSNFLHYNHLWLAFTLLHMFNIAKTAYKLTLLSQLSHKHMDLQIVCISFQKSILITSKVNFTWIHNTNFHLVGKTYYQFSEGEDIQRTILHIRSGGAGQNSCKQEGKPSCCTIDMLSSYIKLDRPLLVTLYMICTHL